MSKGGMQGTLGKVRNLREDHNRLWENEETNLIELKGIQV